MSISLLQRNAFVNSGDFTEQVEGIVAKTAIYRAGSWSEMDDNTRSLLAQVARTPQSYGFVSVIVTDNNWNMKYDEWAANPPGADGVIESFVQTHWLMLTGIKEPVPSEPVP